MVARLEAGTVLRIARQPDNTFDSNAIAVLDPTGAQVGFFNRRLAVALAPEIDGGAAFDVTVTEVTGGGPDESRGVNVLVSRAGAMQEAARDAEARAARRAQLAGLDEASLDSELVRALIGDRTLHAAQSEALAHLAGVEFEKQPAASAGSAN